VDLWNLGEKVFTIRDVVAEIRDSATKQRLAVLPYELNFREPSAQSINAVTEFSKKTGDYKSLSAVDLRVLALTYQLEKEFGNPDSIKTEPTRKAATVNTTSARSDKHILGFYVEKRGGKENEDVGVETGEPMDTSSTDDVKEVKEEEEGEEKEATMIVPEEAEACTEENQTEEAGHVKWEDEGSADAEDDDDNDEDDDDEGGWITPRNLSKVKQALGTVGCVGIGESSVRCACLTTDFAMQNVLIQMGLHVLSVEGRVIRQARSYIQKCFGCYKETHDMTRLFCASCGNKTLKKVAVTVGEDGTMQYHYPRRQRNPNIRGTKFAIPQPKGGRMVGGMLLVEDQPTGKNHLPKSRDKVDPMDPDYAARSNPFATNDVNSRAFNLGLHLKQRQARNPNESKKKKSGRKK